LRGSLGWGSLNDDTEGNVTMKDAAAFRGKRGKLTLAERNLVRQAKSGEGKMELPTKGAGAIKKARTAKGESA